MQMVHKMSFVFLYKSIIVTITVSLDPARLQNKELSFTFYELWHGFNSHITIHTKLYCLITSFIKWRRSAFYFLKTESGTCLQKMTYRGRSSATFNKKNRQQIYMMIWLVGTESDLYANFMSAIHIDNLYSISSN